MAALTASPKACAVTVLRARGRRLCKTVLPDGTVLDYDQARHFDLFALPVVGLVGLERQLDRLVRRPDCAMVRGAPADPGRTRNVRRLLHHDPETGEAPTLRETPRRWLALDIDGPPLPPGVDPRNLATCGTAVLPLLPPAFQGAAHLVQATASHGIKPGARLRLWFWLDRPLTGPECRRWLAELPVDPSVFTANQPIYTAAPLFAAGAADHLPRRLLLVPGTIEVVAPPSADLVPKARSATPHRPRLPARGDRYTLAALAQAAVRVAAAAEGQRHATALTEACSLVRFVREGLLTKADLSVALGDALRRAGKEGAEVEAAAIVAWVCRLRPAGEAPASTRPGAAP